MNLPQAMHPKSSANGFGRRRAERDWGTRFENKVQSGKPHTNRSGNAGAMGKVGVYESPSRERLIYLTTCLIGHPVEVQLKNGSVYSGTCYTTNVEKEFAIILKMARLIKDISFRGQKAEFVSKAPSKTLILPGKEVVQVIAKDVSVTVDGMSNEPQHAKQQEIMIDSYISQPRQVEAERELEPWIPEKDDPQCPESENIFDGHWNRGWDQFETNEMLFGVKSTFDEELYTTKLERGPRMKELEREAVRIAREIEGEETSDLHLAEERGINLHESCNIDEETRYSSVYRGGAIDDGGYEELDDIVMNSHNSETFGGPSASSIKKLADLSHAKSNDGPRVLSSSSLDEAQCSQSSTCADLHHPGSHDLAAQLSSEPSKGFSTSDSDSRVQEDRHHEHGELDSIKELVEEQILTQDAQLPKGEDSKLLDGKKNESDKGRPSSNTTAYAPSSNVYPKNNEKASPPGQPLEDAASAKGSGETQPVNSRGRPGSSTSSNSDCAGALLASSGPGLSPSSSMGSLSSEKSTLNPYAKEFKLNPNAKSFTPSQMPPRPPSPMSDGPFYFQPNVSNLPHMHGMPMGIYSGDGDCVF
ncbi:polyadenylate-binding protein-interacting protein 3 isoform X4 [Populus trichocarpa]|uniref:polyadenylate-binding protein-interacting protein 3 isoform X4 n=1 Tax=Populus trichocarpa TaxID=3694 RepID=UPI000D18B598|nr:polyadenylate-binding protein-interacting protein 3 isoform X4 [Populus trichocarpa]|eukprot:XP_024453823.1 polyadenylate-binding protein-interacting protein 3 isoform X4 [Populus trichocarpa]